MKIFPHDYFNTFVKENENHDVKMIIPSNIANHITIAIPVQIIAIRSAILNLRLASHGSPKYHLKKTKNLKNLLKKGKSATSLNSMLLILKNKLLNMTLLSQA